MARTEEKRPFPITPVIVFTDPLPRNWLFYCCVRIRCHGNIFTDPFPRNGLNNTLVYSPITQQRLYMLQYFT
jgi:hypothetical protein